VKRSDFDALTQGIILATMKATLLRAADIVAGVTQADSLCVQRDLIAQGVDLSKVAKVDRADVAMAFLLAQAKEIPDGD
jgi:hypothetical protein